MSNTDPYGLNGYCTIYCMSVNLKNQQNKQTMEQTGLKIRPTIADVFGFSMIRKCRKNEFPSPDG